MSNPIIRELADIVEQGNPPRPKLKEFKAKCPEVHVLSDYRGGAPDSFWKTFPKNLNLHGHSPYKLNSGKLLEMAIEYGLTDMETVRAVVDQINNGCDLGVDILKHKATTSNNAPSSWEEGMKVMDAMGQWLKDQVVCGPFMTPPENATICSIQTAPKPTGAVRIIVNSSLPKGASVNDCLLDKKMYPASMEGIPELLNAINFCGKNCRFCKMDWVNAYKHFWVKENQLKYQWIKFLDRYFVELCLVFGNVSSVGLYDRGAKIIIQIALAKANFRSFLSIQHLDDLCAVGKEDDNSVERFYKTYREVCETIGVKLAEDDDPEKSFSPRTTGSMLGLWFDSTSWTWWLSPDKIARYVNDIQDLLDTDESTLDVVQSVVGKCMYIKIMLPGSQYHVSYLIRAAIGEDPKLKVHITPPIRRQLEWWKTMIRLCRGMPIPIIFPDEVPNDAKFADSDASGGTTDPAKKGRGVGCVLEREWAWLAWPTYINSNKVSKCCGVQWRHKLSFLELTGHALHIFCFPEKVMNNVVGTYIDNIGTVTMAQKGYVVKCLITDTLLRAINFVATNLNATAYVKKISRCSTTNALAADLISKAQFEQFTKLKPDCDIDPRRVPTAFVKWLDNPTEDMDLGVRIFNEINICEGLEGMI